MSQPQEHRSLFGHSFRIFLIRFSGTFASLVVMIGFSHMLPPAAYGLYQSFWVQLTLLSSIAGLGLGLLIFTYPPDVLKQLLRQLRPVHYFLYGLLLVIAGLAFTLLRYQQLGDWISKGYLSFLFFIFYTISILLEAFVIVIRKYRLLIGTGVCYALAFITTGWWIQQQGFTMEKFLTCLLPFSFLRMLLLFRPFLAFVNDKTESKPQPFRTKEVLYLWMHLGFYDLLSVTILWLDKFVVSVVATAGTAAIYFNGAYDIPFIPVALSAVSNATLMQLNYAKQHKDKARLMQQAGKMLSCVVYPIFFLLLIYSHEFITVVFSDKYSTSVPIFMCAILILPIRAYSNTTILQNLHRGRLINIGVLLDFVVALTLVVPLYYLMDLPGIALSFVISTYVQVTFYLYYSAKLLKVPMLSMIPLKNWLFKASFFAVLVLVLHFCLSGLKPFLSLAIAAGVTGIAALLVLKREMKASA